MANKGGRPKIQIDPAELEKLAVLHPTIEEMAGFFGVSEDTMTMRLKEPVYRDAYKRGTSTGKISLRRKQMAMALNGNATMAIFLGKQYLRQSDRPVEIEDSEQQLAAVVSAFTLAATRAANDHLPTEPKTSEGIPGGDAPMESVHGGNPVGEELHPGTPGS